MSEFVDFLQEQFELFGRINSKRMFGGHGLFYDGLMIGLVADDTLYLKVDKQSKAQFEQSGLAPFRYNKNGKWMTMSYHQAPPEALDDPEVMREWANLAFEAARRSKK
ncbi:MAG: TfoX/Sxy family protein [Pseudomonadota bacterium]